MTQAVLVKYGGLFPGASILCIYVYVLQATALDASIYFVVVGLARHQRPNGVIFLFATQRVNRNYLISQTEYRGYK